MQLRDYCYAGKWVFSGKRVRDHNRYSAQQVRLYYIVPRPPLFPSLHHPPSLPLDLTCGIRPADKRRDSFMREQYFHPLSLNGTVTHTGSQTTSSAHPLSHSHTHKIASVCLLKKKKKGTALTSYCNLRVEERERD